MAVAQDGILAKLTQVRVAVKRFTLSGREILIQTITTIETLMVTKIGPRKRDIIIQPTPCFPAYRMTMSRMVGVYMRGVLAVVQRQARHLAPQRPPQAHQQ